MRQCTEGCANVPMRQSAHATNCCDFWPTPRSFAQLTAGLRECIATRPRGYADIGGGCAIGRCLEILFQRFFGTERYSANEPKSECANQRTRQSIPHQKEKWCEALSLKFARPYYVVFPVFDRSGKVSKSFNSEKFLKKI